MIKWQRGITIVPVRASEVIVEDIDDIDNWTIVYQ